EKKATLLFAITAWNYCLMSSEEQVHMRWELWHIFNNAHNRADFEMLIQRKTELYPRNRRLFMGLEVQAGFTLTSSPPIWTGWDRNRRTHSMPPLAPVDALLYTTPVV